MLFQALFRSASALACAIAVITLAQPAQASTSALNVAGMKLTFADEFTTFDWDEAYNEAGEATGVWRTSYKNGPDKNNLHNRTLPGNGELQVYADKAFPQAGEGSLRIDPFEIIEGGVLRISANPAPQAIRGQIWDRQYTSGMITTWGSFAQRYGVFEMRAKLPKGKALWPAFWLLNQEGGWPPEIDIAEFIGQEPDRLYNVVHTGADGHHGGAGGPTSVGDLTTAFHTYTLDWGPIYCIFYLDGREIWRHATPQDANTPMFMIINLAVGGKWPGKPDAKTQFPANLDVDYVRVWQRAEYVNAPDPKPWPKPKPEEVLVASAPAPAPAAPPPPAVKPEPEKPAPQHLTRTEIWAIFTALAVFASLGAYFIALKYGWPR